MIDEKTYRDLLDDTYDRVDRAFEDVDPDLAEVTVSQGALTVLFNERVRLMLTPQPAVRQLWARRAWMDDRKLGIELAKLVEDTTREAAGVEVRIAAAKEGAP